ncbi:MAG: hypothetical protein K8R57_03890 [Verrucomicrobia bacterium]|nr:hypothetical protein [Verrucomicrobiota bacterium]
MKNLIIRHYHLVLLGIASLIAIGTAVFLITQSLGFQDSLKEADSISKQEKSLAPTASSNAVIAVEHLKNPALWKPSDNGSSPLVSRPYLLKEGKLIDPMVGNEPLYPPVPNQWLIDHQLDYTDVNILDRDPKHKGFTVREEFLAGTDPNDAEQFPPLYTKLNYGENDIRKSSYILEFLGIETNGITDTKNLTVEYQLRPSQPLPNPSKGNRPDTSVRVVLKGETVPGAPFLKMVDYTDKKKTINDTEYDVGELILENTLTGERHTLMKKSSSREYRKLPIELVESVTFHYQLSGAPVEDVTVERGKTFNLCSLDKKHVETYKLVDFSKEGILLNKDGKNYTIKSSSSPSPSSSPSL